MSQLSTTIDVTMSVITKVCSAVPTDRLKNMTVAKGNTCPQRIIQRMTTASFSIMALVNMPDLAVVNMPDLSVVNMPDLAVVNMPTVPGRGKYA